jgi:hypothetical protein
MADEIVQGGLSQAVPPEVLQEAAPPAAAPPLNDYFARVAKQKEESIQLLKNRQAKLLELNNKRKNPMFDPQLLALSSALLRPTKTGSFGESLGYAAEALGSEQEKRSQREQADLKMQMELEQMTQEQQRKMMSQELMMELMGGAAGEAPAFTGAPAAAPAAGAPMTAMPQLAAAPQAAVQAPAAAQKSGLDRYSDAQLMQFAAADPDNGAMIMKFIEERRKSREFGLREREAEVKEESVERFLPGVGAIKKPISFWRQLDRLEGEPLREFLEKNRIYVNTVKLPDGSERVATPEEMAFMQEEKKAKLTERPEEFPIAELGGRNYRVLPSQYRELMRAREEGPEAVQKWLDKFQGRGTGTALSTQQAEAEAAGAKTRAEKLAGSDAEKIDTVRAVASSAGDIINNADAMISFVTDSKTKGAFGQFAKPGVISAIGTLVSQGFNAGEYRIGIPAIEEAKLKLTGTPEEINAATAAAATLANFELGFRVAFLKGQGAVSNTESQVVSRLAGSVSDSPKTLEYKAKLLKARGVYDREFGRRFEDALERNPNLTVEKAKRSPEFKSLRDNYDNHLLQLQKSFIGSSSGSKPTQAPTKSLSDRIFGG